MHDPSDEKKDEENQTSTTISTTDKDSKSNEDQKTNMEENNSPTQSTGAAAVGNSDGDEKPHAMDVEYERDEPIKDEPMSEAANDSNKNNTKDEHNNTSGGSSSDDKKDTTTITNADSKPDQNNNNINNNTNGQSKPQNGSAPGAASAPAPPPPPVLRGTLSFNLETRRHMIRGMWNYENSSTFPPQRFELLRNLDKDDDPTVLPQDGEFHGSFSLAYFHTTSKGKQKERSKVIPESGVKIKFTPIEGKEGEYDMDGEGTNQFGVFNINGSATPSEHEGDPTYDIILRKRYKPTPMPSAAAAAKKPKKRKSSAMGLGIAGDAEAAAEADDGLPLPPPSESFPSRVVCLRGKLQRDQSEDLGATEVVHRINGMWSSGLDLILADPQNVRGLCNKFEYEHKSTLPNNTFPVSGRYSGWFDLTNEDGSRTRINEKDITLKFRKNNAGYHNVEGRGSNAFGKYNISGTMTADNIITIFRHFQARKSKAKDPAAKASAPAAAPKKDPAPLVEPKLKLEDAVVTGGDKTDGSLESIPPPEHGTYSAVSRGIMRLNEDGAHTCTGKWAMTREHFNNGTTSNFAFRLEPHFAAQGAAAMKKANGEDPEEDTGVSLSGAPPGSLTFPIDSAMYKGSFQMKRGATKYTSVIDQQIVLKFRKNTEGSFNVYGRGINSIGTFNLAGKLILSGKSSGHVELYRMYPLPPAPTAPPAAAGGGKQPTPSLPKASSSSSAAASSKPATVPAVAAPVTLAAPAPSVAKAALVRRESSRLVKLPSRLEDDDPNAQFGRLMDKCTQVLKFMREKDVAGGAFFSNPVDPVALGLPTYYQIVSEPMDLGTIQGKLDAGTLTLPDEFGRLVRLVFENAMTFNIEPTHVVHQAARQLLILFNQKFRDIERQADNIRRQHKLPDAAAGKLDPKGKGGKGKKRKGAPEEYKSPKRRRLDEAQAMAASNANAMAALVAAAPPGSTTGGTVSRTEFSMMLQMIQKMQGQIVHTFTYLANMTPDTADDGVPSAVAAVPSAAIVDVVPPFLPPPESILPPMPEKKKPVPKKKEAAPPVDENKPLSFEEQQQLTETINDLPPDKLPGVIKIIRESGSFGDDEEEIDLEIDQLDTVTQRKLQRFVMKHVKPPRRKNAKAAPKKKAAAKKAEPKPKPVPAVPKKQLTPEPKPAGHDSFFAFGAKDDDDSDSESEGEIKASEDTPQEEAKKENNFSLGDGFGDANDDDEDNDDIGNGGFGANWSMSTAKPESAPAAKDAEDDDWGAAREQAEVAKVRDAERKAREEKLHAEAEQAKNQRLADAAARGEEVRAQRDAEAANEARLREQKEKQAEEKKKAARDAARAELQAVEQTVDLDAQRDIMKQFENNYMGDEADGASPSSDFGF